MFNRDHKIVRNSELLTIKRTSLINSELLTI